MPDQSSISGPNVPAPRIPSPNETSLLLKAETAAKLCGVSLRTWRRLEAEGNVPKPVLLGGRIKRYCRIEMLAWAESGCPSRKQWASIRQVEQRRRNK